MKGILLVVALTIYNLLNAQMYHGYHYDKIQMEAQNRPLYYKPIQNVEHITMTLKDSKGKESVYKKQYNENNDLTMYEYIKKGQKEKLYTLEYNKHNLLERTELIEKGEKVYSRQLNHNEDKKILSDVKTSSNGKKLWKKYWNYSNEGCLMEQGMYRKGKLKSKNVYEYHSPCELSKNHFYNGKGKLKKTWSYDCKSEGEELKPQKNTTQVCRWEESDGEFLLKIYQTLNDKGKLEKVVTKLTLDTLPLESSSYNMQGELIYSSTYDKDYSKPIKSVFYHKGNPRWSYEYQYEAGQKTNYKFFFKSKLKRESIYTYRDDGLLVKFESKDKKGEIDKTITLDYN